MLPDNKKQKYPAKVEKVSELKNKGIPPEVILENCQDLVWAVDPQYRLIYGNSKFNGYFENCTGQSLEKGHSVFVHGVPDEQIDLWKGYYDRALQGERFTCEMQTDNPVDPVDIEFVFSPILLKGGKIGGVVVSGRDITHYKQVETALLDYEKELEQQGCLLAKMNKALGSRETLLQKILDILPVGVWIADKDGVLIRGNPRGKQIWGMEPFMGQKEYGRFCARRLPSGEDIDWDNWSLTHTLSEGVTIVDEMLEIEACDGKKKVIINYTAPVLDEEGNVQLAVIINQDITELKQLENALKTSEALNSSIVKCVPDMLMRFDREGRYLDILTRDEDKLILPQEELLGKTLMEVMPKELAEKFLSCIEKALRTSKLQVIQYNLDTPAGKLEFEARVSASGINEVVFFIRDISEYKLYESQLKQLSLFDQLTGMYNRNYFDQQLRRLNNSYEYPITIITTDLDGLKFINDTLGTNRGDELLKGCAAILEQSLRSSDYLARVGGDEFAAILPRTDEKTGEKIVKRIRSRVDDYNENDSHLPLSISIGMAVAENEDQPLEETFKEADDNMYRDKLYQGTGIRSQIIDALLTTLGERDFITKGHAERLSVLTKKMGERIGLSSRKLSDLALLSQVHDLGKVGIPDHILFKEGPLTSEEWEIMRQHPEKGYKIAASSTDLFRVADLILKHHEKWDGSGYPLGLKGKEIPVECRILAIVDAFDAMTNDRPYRKAKSVDEALKELKKCSGRQFDPELLDIFFEIIDEEMNQEAGIVFQ